MFGDDFLYAETDNVVISVYPNAVDEFNATTIINGLVINEGNHIDFVVSELSSIIREKLIKKYKTIKISDIKSKFSLFISFKEYPLLKFDSQTKERMINSTADIKKFINMDLNILAQKILKHTVIMDSITEVYKIKEEFKKRQEMKGLEKPKKKIKSEKYTKAVGNNNILIICEGASAKGGLMPVLGRDGIAYYELKGKPMNTMTASQSKFAQNTELSELYQIVKQEGFNKIVIGADNDLDGIAIAGLCTTFFFTYVKEVLENNMLYVLRTPIGTGYKNRKLIDWCYSIDEMRSLKGEVSYKKGLGSWKVDDLREVISKDGMNRMFESLTFDEDASTAIHEWYSADTTDKRKQYIMENDFELIKL